MKVDGYPKTVKSITSRIRSHIHFNYNEIISGRTLKFSLRFLHRHNFHGDVYKRNWVSIFQKRTIFPFLSTRKITACFREHDISPLSKHSFTLLKCKMSIFAKVDKPTQGLIAKQELLVTSLLKI